MTMRITTLGGAVYSLEYRDLDGLGQRLAILRHRGPDAAAESNRPMDPDRWYQVADIAPSPPEIAAQVRMILDPLDGEIDPVVRCSTTVTSVVGALV